MMKLLIANRGEIARRIARSARYLGCHVGLIVAEGDEEGVALLDIAPEDHLFVPSYLDASAIVKAAKQWGAQLLHPGYGFLSENASFARAVEDVGMIFIGPSPAQMDALGDKARAKALARQIGVPTLEAVFPADVGRGETWMEALSRKKIPGPWLVKASGGGGGRGMRVVRDPKDLPGAVALASSEALAGFGNPEVFVERYMESARHIEVQVFGDGKGKGVALGERECSLQRRHQKLLEESPSPAVDENLRQSLCQSALRFVEETGYRGAGTVEFLLAEDHAFYFLEVNTRLQVEHPVTEEVMKVDLVAAQIELALGRWPRGLESPELAMIPEPEGHAIELRILAEDPMQGFAPTPGELVSYREPSPGAGGIRVESGLVSPSGNRSVVVNPAYDSMVVKLIGYGPTRDRAIDALVRELDGFRISGFATNVDLLATLIDHPVFRQGAVHTRWLEENLSQVQAACLEPPVRRLLTDAALIQQLRLALLESGQEALSSFSGPGSELWFERIGDSQPEDRFVGAGIRLGGKRIRAWASEALESWQQSGVAGHRGRRLLSPVAQGLRALEVWCTLRPDGRFYTHLWGIDACVDLPRAERQARVTGGVEPDIVSPMPGKILKVLVQPGSVLVEGQVILVLESMKMQIEIKCPAAARLESLHVAQGDRVDAGQALALIKENPA